MLKSTHLRLAPQRAAGFGVADAYVGFGTAKEGSGWPRLPSTLHLILFAHAPSARPRGDDRGEQRGVNWEH